MLWSPQLQQGFATGETGFSVRLHGSNPEPLMSALGQKRTLKHFGTQSWNVRFVPKADSCTAANGTASIS